MFTGIVQSLGTVRSFEAGELCVEVAPFQNDPWQIGESVSVNGCCLTLVADSPTLRFDLSEETLSRTSFSTLRVGHVVNVERAMKAGDRFGGHWVQGHVDEVGKLIAVSEAERSHLLTFEVPGENERYLVDKGSISIDGISLTVVSPQGGRFGVSVIPHTWLNTNLAQLQQGSSVNLEFDILAKYVERLVQR